MDEKEQILFLKNALRKEISNFCRVGGGIGKEAISDTVQDIRKHKWDAVFFGGTLRSLLWSRVKEDSPGLPRDIDIVTRGASYSDLEKVFQPYIRRRTRFGGLKLLRSGSTARSREWEFDIWPLEETYAIKESGKKYPTFRDLPETTFFNVESIAVDVWSKKGRSRNIYSKDDQFFKGVINRTIEIINEDNPFPELCVVRSLVMASHLEWKVGPRLLRYLFNHGVQLSVVDFERIQEEHYGAVKLGGSVFKRAMEGVVDAIDREVKVAVELVLPSRLALWPEDEDHAHRLWIRSVASISKK